MVVKENFLVVPPPVGGRGMAGIVTGARPCWKVGRAEKVEWSYTGA